MREITLDLRKEVMEFLEEWREMRLDRLSEVIDETVDSPLKIAYIANYKGMKNADYDQLVKFYLDYQAIERRYENEEKET